MIQLSNWQVQHLLMLALKQASLAANTDDFTELTRQIHTQLGKPNMLGEKYLYRTFKQTQDQDQLVFHQYQRVKIDLIARFAGFDSSDHFLSHLEKDATTAVEKHQGGISQAPDFSAQDLNHLCGTYRNYVRENSGLPKILSSPVEIYPGTDGQHYMRLKGTQREYRGRLVLRNNCLCCLLTDEKATKELHLVFLLGQYRSPNLLIGLFSGVASHGIPIAGREILKKEKHAVYEEMNVQEFTWQKQDAHCPGLPEEIFNYLKDFKRVYFKVMQAGGDDLGNLGIDQDYW